MSSTLIRCSAAAGMTPCTLPVQGQGGMAGRDILVILRKVDFFNSLRVDQLQACSLRSLSHVYPIYFGLCLARQCRRMCFRLTPSSLYTVLAVPQELLGKMTISTYEDGRNVFGQGEVGDGMYIITSGQAVVMRMETEGGEEKELMRLQQSTFFGERALLKNEPRAATVRAVGPLTTMFISREAFEHVLGPLQAASADCLRQCVLCLCTGRVEPSGLLACLGARICALLIPCIAVCAHAVHCCP